ncbi:RagB/SusD family nutrient uptake outer membrane protein [Sphingobacterium sp. SGG-5]|uniref:RagB/SusD family nutrient uptake outer membrane protein n=1 Tax=Sphingobacterium sp. SGG-5 TaxID=2710881 RepID=UPI0013EBF63F|nr:RagB/SusD family nutrient uptake outer membrane protein [Sphingobacterium sp. SGG-5]NGM60428.1 RagB/SusD family nutrient uptake outer membrane protein [Sphingobacterium sp. SGG-5]
MRQIYVYFVACFATVLLTLFSCKDLLDVQPGQAVDTELSLTSVEGFEAATMGVYAVLRSTAQYGQQLIVYPTIMSNTGAHSGVGSALLNLSRNARLSHMNPWATGYKAISQINVILIALEDFEADQQWKNSIAGQLHFLRALFFHNLSRVYGYDPTAIGSTNRGTVPLTLQPVYSWDNLESLARASIPEMYAFLYDELEKAYAYLEGTSNERAPGFATQGAVAALFSRVALYNGDYPKVIEEANKAIASHVGRLSTTASYYADWRTPFHPESLFEVGFRSDQNVGPNNSIRAAYTNRVSESSDAVSGSSYVMVSDMLYAQYAAGDVRRTLIMKGVGNESGNNQMTKFFSRGGQINLDNVPVIRLSEVYLNRAEAYANISGMEPLAVADVNLIRNRAGLTSVPTLFDVELMEEVLLQRRLELAFEGHSWFDYKRLGRNIPKPTGTTFLFSDYRILPRIPVREVAIHPDLKQNRGY